jgi:hypothetical protein
MSLTDWLKPKTPGPWPFTMPRPLPDVAKYQKLLVQGIDLSMEWLLSDWRWLFDASYRPIVATACGGLFLERAGAIYWLDDAMGQLTQVAASKAELEQAVRQLDHCAPWFKPDVVHAAEQAHRPLRSGECFSYTLPPAVGGDYAPRNVMPTPLPLHLQIHGQLHRQFRELPKGTRIRKFDLKRTDHGYVITVVTDRGVGSTG